MDSQRRSVRARGAWLLAVVVAMFAAMISLPTPAEAQPRANIAPCERVLFGAFYAASVEGVPQSGLTACLSGVAQPTNRVFTSWANAPRLLRHLEHIDRRLLSGVTRPDLPSPGQVALANHGALIARCELVEETPDAGLEVDASGDADADGGASRHRSRVHLSRTAMREHAWDPFAWFPSRCARRMSIEIRPAEATMVSRVVRTDVFVAEAARRLADPARDLGSIPALVSGLQSRLADTTGDPIPSSLFPPLANACLATIAALPATCFTAGASESGDPVADTSATSELARLRAENGRLVRENNSLRTSNKKLPKILALWLGVLALLALIAFIVGALIKRTRSKPKVEQGVETQDPSPSAIIAAATAAERTRRHYEDNVIPELRRQWEEADRRHFQTMTKRHTDQLADEVDTRLVVEGKLRAAEEKLAAEKRGRLAAEGKLLALEEELGNCRAALHLTEDLTSPDTNGPTLTLMVERWDALASAVQTIPPPSIAEIGGESLEPTPVELIDAAAELARRLAEFASKMIPDDDPRQSILKPPRHATVTAEKVDLCVHTAFDIMAEWRERTKAANDAIKQTLGSEPQRETFPMLEPEPRHGPPVAATNPDGTGPLRHTPTLQGLQAVVLPPEKPET